MGKPKPIDQEQVEKLAMLGCPVVDIAWVLNCSTDTLYRRFAADIDKGKAKSRTRLRQLMWQSAEKGSVAMQIFLSKQILGFSDKTEDVEANGATEETLLQSITSKG